jgi:hypothetical protein
LFIVGLADHLHDRDKGGALVTAQEGILVRDSCYAVYVVLNGLLVGEPVLRWGLLLPADEVLKANAGESQLVIALVAGHGDEFDIIGD